MTPKEKAYELIDKMHNVDFHDLPDELAMQFKHAKQCAIIAADEVLGYMGADRGAEFWQEVKIEIEKL